VPARILLPLLFVLGVCAAVRAGVLMSAVARLDADEAVTGIMARRILEGDLFLYYAGQHYMGAGEQYLQAVSLALLPDSALTLRLPQLLLSVVTCGLVYVVGARVLRSHWLGLLAAGLYAVGPYFTVFFGVRAAGAVAFGTLVGLAGIWFASAFGERHGRDPWLAGGFGLACGLGFWLAWSSALLLLPAAVWIAGSARGRLLQLYPAAAAGFAVGALPVWVFATRYGYVPSPLEVPNPPTTIIERADTLVSAVLPMFVGLKLPNASPLADWFPANLLFAAVVAVFAVAVYRRRSGLAAALTLKQQGRRPIDLVLVAFLLLPLVWLASEFAWYTGEPRHLMPLSPLLAIGVAGCAGAGRRHARTVGAILLLTTAGLTALALHQVSGAGGGGAVIAGERIHTGCLARVVGALEGDRVSGVYADYWVAYPLQFVADERLSVAPFSSSRFGDLTAAVERDPNPAYVAPVGGQARVLAAKLENAGTHFERRNVCSYTVFTRMQPVIRPQALGVA
jgi:Dolichyl-phosphate-mannose-protein mannosyltransferase